MSGVSCVPRYLQEISADSNEDKELTATLDATMSDLESGKTVPANLSAEPSELWKHAMSHSSFFSDRELFLGVVLHSQTLA